jgi:hypothetical protein
VWGTSHFPVSVYWQVTSRLWRAKTCRNSKTAERAEKGPLRHFGFLSKSETFPCKTAANQFIGLFGVTVNEE